MKIFIKLLSSLFLGLSLIFIVSPFLLYWFIHGDYDRYIWIINGPYPFSSFGGGPFQLFMFLGLLLIGIVFLIIGLILNRGNKKRSFI